MTRIARGLSITVVAVLVLLLAAARTETGAKWSLLGRAIGSHFVREKIPAVLGSVESDRGATHESLALEQSVRYIRSVYENFAHRIPQAVWRGGRVLEVGPGDNLGVPLLFVAAGASQGVGLDKFRSRRDEEQERRIYAALREKLPPEQQARFDEAVELKSGIRFNPAKIEYIYGIGIEEAAGRFPPASFQAIISQAVLQEIPGLDDAFDVMDKLLAPGGYMAHQVDFRDYGLFSSHGFHRLEFLTVSDFLYERTGKPNRRLVDYYRRRLQDLGYRFTIYITNPRAPGSDPKTELVSGVDYPNEELERVRALRPRLLPRFQRLSDEDLLVESAFLLAEKPR